jgi:hypothetical protein
MGAFPCHADRVTETEMMQQVIAILTQSLRAVDALDGDESMEDLNPDTELVGQLIQETMDFNQITVTGTDPQVVANAVAEALTLRVGLLASCLIATFTRLAYHHDQGDADVSSIEVLQRLALDWQSEDGNS